MSDDEEQTSRSFADRLDELEVEPNDRTGGEGEEGSEEESGEDSAASPQEQFEAALEGLSPGEMRAKKFGVSPEEEAGDGADSGGTSDGAEGGSSGSCTDRRDSGGPTGRDDRVGREQRRRFERAMQDVEPLEESSKYRRIEAPDPERFLEEDSTRTAEDFVTPRLPKSGEGLTSIPKLVESQRQMLDRCERWTEKRDLPEVNLRGDSVREAIARLSNFVEEARGRAARFVRIVHGRGRQSDGPPAVKPAVLEWLESRAADLVRGYVPERQFGGDYGSTVVELLDAE